MRTDVDVYDGMALTGLLLLGWGMWALYGYAGLAMVFGILFVVVGMMGAQRRS